MAGSTTNFGLTLPVGDDLFNPLWSNSNTTKIDAQMKENQNNSITNADCVFNTNKFIITRSDTSGKYFKFIAPVDYVAGYTFQVDGTAYDGIVAGTGDALASSCFMANHEVIAYIDTTSASLAFLVGSSLPEQIDANTLDGHEASYFGTASSVQSANDAAVAAGTVANQALEAANKNIVYLGTGNNTWGSAGEDLTFTTTVPTNAKFIIVNTNHPVISWGFIPIPPTGDIRTTTFSFLYKKNNNWGLNVSATYTGGENKINISSTLFSGSGSSVQESTNNTIEVRVNIYAF